MSMESCHCKRSLIATGWGMCSSKGVSPWLYLYGYLPLSVLEVRGRFCLLGAYFAGTLKFFESFKCFFKNIFEYLVRGLACDRWSPFGPCGWDKMTKVGSKWFLVLWEVSFDLLAIGYLLSLRSCSWSISLYHRWGSPGQKPTKDGNKCIEVAG